MKLIATAGVLWASLIISSCVQAQPATDMGDPGFPFGPTTGIATGPLAYVPDIKPILDQDCVQCPGRGRTDGDYRADTYADVMRNQRPGDASSSLVVDCALAFRQPVSARF
jgi:hypothetical protein